MGGARGGLPVTVVAERRPLRAPRVLALLLVDHIIIHHSVFHVICAPRIIDRPSMLLGRLKLRTPLPVPPLRLLLDHIHPSVYPVLPENRPPLLLGWLNLARVPQASCSQQGPEHTSTIHSVLLVSPAKPTGLLPLEIKSGLWGSATRDCAEIAQPGHLGAGPGGRVRKKMIRR